MSEPENKIRQKHELEAIASIYYQEVTTIKKYPLDINIDLIPTIQQDSSNTVHVKLTLHVQCCEKYPERCPIITLEKVFGLSNHAKRQLLLELQQEANNLIGEEMISELANYVKDYLLKYNKPTKSLYDERNELQTQRSEQESELKQQEYLKKKQEIIVEMQEARHSNSDVESSDDFSDFDDPDDNYRASISTDEIIYCIHENVTIKFPKLEVTRRDCIEHINENVTTYSAINPKTNEIFCLTEWTIEITDVNRSVINHIQQIEKEFYNLSALNHRNIFNYIDLCYKHSEDDQILTVYVLKEFICGSNLRTLYLKNKVLTGLSMIRHIADGILRALEYLHVQNVALKDINPSCIYIDNKGVVRVQYYNVTCELQNMDYLQTHNNETVYTKQRNIFMFGKLLLNLLTGQDNNIEIPKKLPPKLQDFLKKCLTNEKNTITARNLLNHPFLTTVINDIQFFIPEENSDESSDNSDIALFQSQNSSNLEMIKKIGHGAFGEVLQVRNKVDRREYALKKIKIKQKNYVNVQKEVEFLSKLNHENVVRYYNSWIEDDKPVENKHEEPSMSSEEYTNTIEDDIEKLTPAVKGVNNILREELPDEEESSENSSDDSLEIESESPIYNESSESSSNDIAFEDGDEQVYDTVPERLLPIIQVLCIQMEYCEKTLKTDIDANLYQHKTKVWKRFGEIVDGLSYIHDQKLIHRDLKPVNIFIDFNDKVKIGDFGLATSNLILNPEDGIVNNQVATQVNGSMTSQVGTFFYIAPELLNKDGKIPKSSKVDIYSLGIIFFEMCYGPMHTGMERNEILTKLRSKDIELPIDFQNTVTEKKFKALLLSLLNHDGNIRPTCEQIKKKYFPKDKLQWQGITKVLSDPKTKDYKTLITSCFKQPCSAAQDILYDKGNSRRSKSMCNMNNYLHCYDTIKEDIVKIFKLHGYQNFTTPLLIPKSKYYEDVDCCVKLMTQSGLIVSIPYDHRIPFARYVALNNITSLRRYSIDRVYNEKKVCIPQESYECTFDIVSDSSDGNYVADAEVIFLLSEIMSSITTPNSKTLYIRLNHFNLLASILIHFGVNCKDVRTVNKWFAMVSECKMSKAVLESNMLTLGISKDQTESIILVVIKEYNFKKLKEKLKPITDRKTDSSKQIESALTQIENILKAIENFGKIFKVVILPSLIVKVHQYSGMICQLISINNKFKKKVKFDILAVGGRYDKLITDYREPAETVSIIRKEKSKQFAVGISIYLEKFVQIILEDETNEEITKSSFLDAVVCSIGRKRLHLDEVLVLKLLWFANIRAMSINVTDPLDVDKKCKELNVQYAVMLKDESGGVSYTIHSPIENIRDKKVCQQDLVEHLTSVLKRTTGGDLCELMSVTHPTSMWRSESKVSNSDKQNVDIEFDHKEDNPYKKRNQIRKELESVFKQLVGDIVVLVTNFDQTVLSKIHCYLNFDSEETVLESIKMISNRKRSDLNDFCLKIFNFRNEKSKNILILYSLSDSSYEVLL